MAQPRIVRKGIVRHIPVATATLIALGDLCALVSNLLVKQSSVGQKFMGVALSVSNDGEIDLVLVLGENSEVQVDAVSSQYKFGDLLEFSAANTVVIKSANQALMMVVEKDTGSSATSVRAELLLPEPLRP